MSLAGIKHILMWIILPTGRRPSVHRTLCLSDGTGKDNKHRPGYPRGAWAFFCAQKGSIFPSGHYVRTLFSKVIPTFKLIPVNTPTSFYVPHCPFMSYPVERIEPLRTQAKVDTQKPLYQLLWCVENMATLMIPDRLWDRVDDKIFIEVPPAVKKPPVVKA